MKIRVCRRCSIGFKCLSVISKHLEKLGKAHKKLEKAHSSLFDEQNKKKHVETCNVGLTCDIIDESLSMPIIVAPLTLLVVLLPPPHLVVMVSLVMPHNG